MFSVLVRKWLSSFGSKRLSMGIAGLVVSGLVTFGSTFDIPMDDSTRNGLTLFVASLLMLIFADSQRPLDPRDSNGQTIVPK